MFKIVITGPESSGKTTLARALAEHFQCPIAPEFARDFLAQLPRPYQMEDLPLIAQGQLAIQRSLARSAKEWLICDTGMIVLRVWSRYKFGKLVPGLDVAPKRDGTDLYLLCHPNMPWEPDPLREHPDEREQLLALYLQELQSLRLPYAEITAKSKEERLTQAIQIISSFFSDRT